MVNKSTNPKALDTRIESLVADCQEYDRLGRNLSEQRRRQNKIPWTKVRYERCRLVDRGPI